MCISIINYVQSLQAVETPLAEWDNAEMEQRMRNRRRTATAYTLAAMIGFGALTGSYTPWNGFAVYGGRAVYADEYRTVDDILAPLKNKVFVNKDTYKAEVARSEKAIVFFYNGNDVDGAGGDLARVYKPVMNQFQDIKIICYDKDKENLPGSFYLRTFGFKGTPYTIFFSGGINVYEIDGGPKEGYVKQWIPWLTNMISKKL